MTTQSGFGDISEWSSSPLARGSGHSYAGVTAHGGNVVQGDSNTIKNYYSVARGSSDNETTDSSSPGRNGSTRRAPNTRFIVPRCSALYFTGRSLQLRQLHDYLSLPPDDGLSRRIVVIVGTGGAGKTQFCLKYAEIYQS